MTYTIYHIPEKEKIGLTKDLKRRMKQHEWNGSYEILEVHEDPQIAGDRELELQAEYGYQVDYCHYLVSVSHLPVGRPRKFTKEQVLDIRSRKLSYKNNAKKYNVTPRTIAQIVKRETYKDV